MGASRDDWITRPVRLPQDLWDDLLREAANHDDTVEGMIFGLLSLGIMDLNRKAFDRAEAERL